MRIHTAEELSIDHIPGSILLRRFCRTCQAPCWRLFHGHPSRRDLVGDWPEVRKEIHSHCQCRVAPEAPPADQSWLEVGSIREKNGGAP